MKDIEIKDGNPIVTETIVHKAVNVLKVQLGSLHYAQDFGIDLDQFFSPDVEIQTESFKAYAVERLAASGVNVTNVGQIDEILSTALNFEVTEQQTEGLVAR